MYNYVDLTHSLIAIFLAIFLLPFFMAKAS